MDGYVFGFVNVCKGKGLIQTSIVVIVLLTRLDTLMNTSQV